MADDLLNSLIDNMNDDDQSDGLAELLSDMGATPAAEPDSSDMLGGLAGLLGGGMGGDASDDMAGLLGGGAGGGLAGLLGGGGMGGMLGALLGGGSGASSPTGGLMSGGGGADLSQMPIVGPIITSLAEKFGIPPAQASALLMAAISMLSSKKDRSGMGRGETLDISGLLDDAPQHRDLIAQAAQEAGLNETQAATGMQDALQMLVEAMQEQ